MFLNKPSHGRFIEGGVGNKQPPAELYGSVYIIMTSAIIQISHVERKVVVRSGVIVAGDCEREKRQRNHAWLWQSICREAWSDRATEASDRRYH